MAVNTLHTETNSTYFITFTCFKWILVFDITGSYAFIEDWFIRLNNEGNRISGCVIMPNYLHRRRPRIDKAIGEGKRFMAYLLVKQLKRQNRKDILEQPGKGVENKERENGKLHTVFQPSFDAKLIYTDKFAEQVPVVHFRDAGWV